MELKDAKEQVESLLRELRDNNIDNAIKILQLWLEDIELALEPAQKDGETFAEYLNRKHLFSLGLYAKEAENGRK